MTNKEHATIGETPLPQERKAWSTPSVTLLSMDDTALNATSGNDGRGPTTGS